MAVRPQSFAVPNAPASDVVVSIDPATGETLAQFAATPPSALPAIFERARRAQRDWAARPLRERAAFLRRLRDAIFAGRDEIASAISREAGKPRVEALLAEVFLAIDTAGFAARHAPRWLRPERVPHHSLALRAKSGWLEYFPHGVVAIISPWNYPFAIPMVATIPALAAGNAVILKPSELTPSTGALVGDLCRAAGIPPDLLQIVHGAGDLGAALMEAAPDKVFFTGSAATGRLIAEACARKLIPSVLELGGKDAMIVLADADLDIASSAAVWGGFMNCGQTCISVERIYVEQPVAERFTQLCVEKTKRLRVGPASDPDNEIGPMIRPRQREKVEEQLADAVAHGAQILTGGERLPALGPNFLAPAVVTQVDHSMPLMRDETFGPVIAIHAVASADEAVTLANDSPFALSGSIWTSNAARGRLLALRLRAGAVMINDVASYYGICEAPHGGLGASGWGRTHGRLGLLEMVHAKYIDVDRLPRTPKPWWFGYSQDLADSADSFVKFLFAPRWHSRLSAAVGRRKALSLLFRRDRI